MKIKNDRYLWEKISGKTESKTVFYLLKIFIESSSLPLIGLFNKFLARNINYHLFTFINGRCFEKKFNRHGNYLRIGNGCLILYPKKIDIGDFVSFGNYVTIYNEANGGKIKIGSNSHIIDFTLISGVGGIEIGNNTLISSGVKIYSHSNEYKNRFKLVRDQIKKGKIIIGNNVLVGANAVILPGMKIGNNSIIGAGAVVTKNVPENTIAIGVPARTVLKK